MWTPARYPWKKSVLKLKKLAILSLQIFWTQWKRKCLNCTYKEEEELILMSKQCGGWSHFSCGMWKIHTKSHAKNAIKESSVAQLDCWLEKCITLHTKCSVPAVMFSIKSLYIDYKKKFRGHLTAYVVIAKASVSNRWHVLSFYTFPFVYFSLLLLLWFVT